MLLERSERGERLSTFCTLLFFRIRAQVDFDVALENFARTVLEIALGAFVNIWQRRIFLRLKKWFKTWFTFNWYKNLVHKALNQFQKLRNQVQKLEPVSENNKSGSKF